MPKYKIVNGDCLEMLKALPDNSIDSIVTDPPYGLSNATPEKITEAMTRWASGERDFLPAGKGFMGKAWDSFVPPPAVWDECLRVLKPGGHLLAFAGSRTQDLMGLSVRLAGFEIRDSIAWLYGSGFPKSHNVALGIDKLNGAENRGRAIPTASKYQASDVEEKNKLTSNPVEAYEAKSEESAKWQGWGTALKPAVEPIIVARKPLEGTVAQNVLKYGVGGLNIDATRIGANPGYKYRADANGTTFHGQQGERIKQTAEAKGSEFIESTQGRWPANLILDETTAEMLDEQSDASRFFYVAKANKKDRNEGLEELEAKFAAAAEFRPNHMDKALEGESGNPFGRFQPVKNFHPTVKPTALMEYLVKLVTPEGGTVLDPFTGSGSTGKAALMNGFDFYGIEITEEYLPIIEGRLKWAVENPRT